MTPDTFLSSPEHLQFYASNPAAPLQGNVCWGGNQLWFSDHWQRQAGCAPTTCALLGWYLAKTHSSCANLCLFEESSQENLLLQMDKVWNHMTPGTKGVNTSHLFVDGMLSFAQQQKVKLTPYVLEIPRQRSLRPSVQHLYQFCQRALADNLPIAFLNLSNGSLRNLESWHWVLLSGINENPCYATMINAGKRTNISIGRWLNSSFLGGSMVYFSSES